MLHRLLVFVALLVPAAVFAAPPPEWLLAAARSPAPASSSPAAALVLLNETAYGMQPDGRCVVTHRLAVRVLSRSGSEYARGAVDYLEKRDAVRSTEAWLVRAGKEVRPPKTRDWLDVSDAATGAVFDESRSRAVSYTDLAIEGDVFGFETKIDRRLLFGQFGYGWDNSLPVLVERVRLSVPAGWSCDPVLDGPEVAAVATVAGPPAWSWELRDRPYRPDEPAMADGARLDARLMVNLRPSPDAKAPIVFGSWSEVADWDLRNGQGQCDTDPALAAAVQKLTSGCPDPLSRIRVLSRHVQQLRYVAINKGLAAGMGYRPRKATEVLAKGWGDCKDKANLLCAMLHETGIEAFSVSAQLGGGRRLNPGWPSLQQFNHAIAAIRVDSSVALPSVLEVAGLGRLLFFDATDPDTLVGDLPWSLQGTKVHVLVPGNAALTTLPVLPTETRHVVDRRVQLQLDASGAVAGECSYGGPGRVGSIYRQRIRTMSAKDLRTDITERINATVRGARIDDLTTGDDPLTGECRFKYRFSAPRFAQMMAGGLAVVRLDVLSRDAVPAFPAKDRKLPIGLEPWLQRDEVTLKLPAGFVVDELPDRTALSSPYGHYESSYEADAGAVVARRVLQIEDRTVPAAEYAALKKFLVDVAKADHSSVVLRQAEAAPVPAPAK